MPSQIHRRTGGKLARLAIVGALAAWHGVPGLSAQAVPDGPGKIGGVVVEAGTGYPIPDAQVVLEALDDRAATPTSSPASTTRIARVLTDAAGRYAFDGLAPGSYRIEVSGLGFRTSTVWVELPRAWRVRRSFELPIDPIELRPLTVSSLAGMAGGRGGGTPEDPPAAPPGAVPFGTESGRVALDARGLTPEDVETVATVGEPDVLRALQRLPGVSGRGDYSAGIWTRGAPWGLTQVLLDGLPLYDALHLGGVATGVASDGLEAAYLFPGARPAAVGEGAAGVVSLVSRRARGSGTRGLLAVSPVAVRARLEGRWLEDRLGVSLTGRRSWWDVVDPPSLFAGGSSGPIDYHFGDVSGRVDFRMGEVGTVEAGGLLEEDRIDGDIPDLVSGSEGRWGNRVGWIAFHRPVGAEARVRLFAGRSAYEAATRPKPWMSFYGRDGVPSVETLGAGISRSVLRVEAAGRLVDDALEWNAGLEHARESLVQHGAEAADRGAPGEGEPARISWSRGWAEGTLRRGPLTLSAGLSLDGSGDDLPGLGFRPAVRARWQATDALRFELARSESRQFAYPVAPAGRSFGPALRVGSVWFLAGEGRPPLTSRVTTLSVEARPTPALTALLTAWRRRTDGLWMEGVTHVVGGALVAASPDSSSGREWAEGVEVTLRGEWSRFGAEASYTLGRSELAGGSGIRWASPADRRHSLDLFATGRVVRGLELGTLFRLESGWPIVVGPWACNATGEPCQGFDRSGQPDEHSVGRGPAYASLDLLLAWHHRRDEVSWALSASLRNVLGRDNAAVYRAGTCLGAELVSVACERAVGEGRFAPGLTSPTPALSLRLFF